MAELERVRTLRASDRCDRCRAAAYVFVILTSGYDLLFCGHCYEVAAMKLQPLVDTIVDERWALVAKLDVSP